MPLGRLLPCTLLLSACVEAPVAPPPARSEPNPPTPEEPPPDTDVEDSEEPSGPDCSVLPPLPAPFHTLEGFGRAEDFDLDGQGFHGSVPMTDLVVRNQAGEQHVIAPNVGEARGTRLLPSGDWVFNGGDALVHVAAATGAHFVLLGGLAFPNGLEVDRQGRAYVSEMFAGRVQRIDPVTLASAVVVDGLQHPNGIILSPDEQMLYVVSFSARCLYAMEQTAPDVWGPPVILWEPPPDSDIYGGFDGLNVDVCGNLYFTEFGGGRVWRVTPDGQRYDLVAELPAGWIPNMRWGHGIGGWERDVLYVSDRDQGRIFGIEVGIDGKKHVMAR